MRFRRTGWLASPFFFIAGLATGSAAATPPDLLSLVVNLSASPLAEELIFRGWMYRQAQHGRQRLSLPGLVLITALFAASHFTWYWPYFMLLVALGCALHLVRHFSGSVLLAVLCHAGFNAGAFAR
ncbi:lysostaphin resistance A-like protein [Lysobacter xanthus]